MVQAPAAEGEGDWPAAGVAAGTAVGERTAGMGPPPRAAELAAGREAQPTERRSGEEPSPLARKQ